MSKRVLVIDATLTNSAGDVFPVSLIVTVTELLGSAGVEDEEVARRELFDKVPDGEYILEHFSPKPFHGKARVANGSLEVL
jgi:hypothetical protein